MAEFEDNAVVTAEDLNNIAVDLGDTTFSAFSDEKFGVDKLNEITADIVGKGVLNIGSKCEVIVNEGAVYIQPGVIVFESGAKIRITEPLEVPSEASVYIYAYNDTVTGKASIQTSSGYPSSGDYVMLARHAGGTITDLRQYSVAKTTLSADVENTIVEQEVIVPTHPQSAYYYFKVSPHLIPCRFITLLTVNDKRDHLEYSYQGCYLTENFQEIYVNQDWSGRGIQVRKIDGLLEFQIGEYSYINQFKFVLA